MTGSHRGRDAGDAVEETRPRVQLAVARLELVGQQAALRRCQDLQGDTTEGHPPGEFLVAHALRQHDALDARVLSVWPMSKFVLF
jgi:hypothetical protein